MNHLKRLLHCELVISYAETVSVMHEDYTEIVSAITQDRIPWHQGLRHAFKLHFTIDSVIFGGRDDEF